MNVKVVLLLSAGLLFASVCSAKKSKKPNIVYILADDLGWNDVGFHGSEIPTPNIDALAYSGVILDNYYVQPMCSPSRSALMTGKHPTLTGLQHDAIISTQADGIPLKEKIMPEYLKDLGYKTHMIGKWHLGFFKKEYTPTFRGFDSHYGYWPAYVDYFNHTSQTHQDHTVNGYAMRRGMKNDYSNVGKYATDVFTDETVSIIKKHDSSKPLYIFLSHLAVHSGSPDNPLQAPEETIEKFSYIKDEKRRIFAAMVSKLDDSVGLVVKALADKGILDNTIIGFSTDNGGTNNPPPNEGSAGNNFPLRGTKTTHWQGGIKGVGFIWSPLLKKKQRVSHDLMHIKDWLPTLCSAIGGGCDTHGRGLDSDDFWESLSEGKSSSRKELLINIDYTNPKGAIIKDDYKLIYGQQRTDYTPVINSWYDTSDGYISKYSYSDVLNSRAYKAIKAATKERLCESKMSQLRSSIKVSCGENSVVYCDPALAPCLFNIHKDPCEYTNLAEREPHKKDELLRRLESYNRTVVAYRDSPIDPQANPALHNNIWVNWCDINNNVCQLV